MRSYRIQECLLAAALIAADQLSKTWALGVPLLNVFPGFRFYLAHNPGMSFSLLNDGHAWQYWLLISIAVIACAYMIRWWLKTPSTTTRLALVCIFAGAAGNLIDRIRYDAVIDFIDVYYQNWHFPTFNIADACITLGAVFILLRKET